MSGSEAIAKNVAGRRESAWTVFKAFLKLGWTSFGGPIAHLGYFREEFVNRRKWITDRAYADLVALCPFTPGPASSKVGIGIGLSQAGLPMALAAWIAFTAPSALALILFGFGIIALGDWIDLGWLHGLVVVAVPVVAQAVWGMARSLTPDAPRITLAALSAIVVLIWPTPLGFIGAIIAGGIAGSLLFKASVDEEHVAIGANVRRTAADTALALFFGLLVALPALRAAFPSSQTLALLDSFYRAGSLVFGGGNVVLPLLQAEVGPPGWVSNEAFFAGYGAAQAVPGPLFTFAAYLGTVSAVPPNGWLGALICLAGIFASSFLLVIGPLPFWDALRRLRPMRSALTGINAAVVGMLLAFLYDPVWTNAIRTAADFGLALAGFVLLMFWKLPPWLVVVLTAAGGAAVGWQEISRDGATSMKDADLYGGLIRLHILHHASKEPVFGLGIIEELGRHGYKLSPGTVYPMLHSMEAAGYLRSRPRVVVGKMRRTYRITAQGRKALAAAKEKVTELFGELFEDNT